MSRLDQIKEKELPDYVFWSAVCDFIDDYFVDHKIDRKINRSAGLFYELHDVFNGEHGREIAKIKSQLDNAKEQIEELNSTVRKLNEIIYYS